MARHVVFGAGPVGRQTAMELLRRGEEVTVASRSGQVNLEGVTVATIDAADAEAVTRLVEGSVALYNAINPAKYHRWPTDWPPMAAALLTAAERTGATLVTASNLYAYGPVSEPMREGMPDASTDTKGVVRATMWAEALAAHRAGRAHVVEVRSSDYVGAGAGGHIPRLVPAALAGKTARVLGSPDMPHTWTDVTDVARVMAHVAVTPAAWGRVWHAPSNPARTQRQALTDICASVGRPAPKVASIPGPLLSVLSALSATMREVAAMRYQFDAPFVMDSSAALNELGLAPTAWDEVCRRTAAG